MEVDSAAEPNKTPLSDKPRYVLLTNSRSLALSQREDSEFFYFWHLILIHRLKDAVKGDMCQ